MNIRPHSAVDRLPRSLKERKFWKAKELQNWLLYYSVPILQKFALKNYTLHWMLLVEGVYILLQDEITFDELNRAQNLLFNFQRQTKSLYGAFAMTYNVHQLSHLTESVANWGPLFAHNGFAFKNANGMLLQNIHATKGVKEQICRFIRFRKCINYLLFEFGENNEFDRNEKEHLYRTKKTLQIEERFYFGKPETLQQEYSTLFRTLSPNSISFDRLLKDGRFHSNHDKNKQTNNSFALLTSSEYVKLTKFIYDKTNEKKLCFVKKVFTTDTFQNSFSML